MRTCERRCAACGELADGPPSAHFARVLWLCRQHSAEFHAPAMFRVFRSASSTCEAWAAIDLWVRNACVLAVGAKMLRLVPMEAR